MLNNFAMCAVDDLWRHTNVYSTPTKKMPDVEVLDESCEDSDESGEKSERVKGDEEERGHGLQTMLRGLTRRRSRQFISARRTACQK